MHALRFALAGFTCLFQTLIVCGQETKPGTGTFDLPRYIAAEIKSGKKTITVPPGRYRVTPVNREHLKLADLHDVEIIADGVEMVCTETTRALTIVNCRNVKVRGLTIDYDPLPFTEGRIVAMATNKQWFDIELFAGYPDEGVRTFKMEIFEPVKNTLRTEDYGNIEIVKQSPGRYRVTKPPGFRFAPTRHREQIGDIVVTAVEHTTRGSIPHAVYCDQNTHVTLENIRLFASNCFGFLETNCDGSQYLRCLIDRRAPGEDPVKRGYPRVRSLNADAYHSKHAVRGPAIIGCTARFQGDDCVNICGDYHMIMGSQGRDLRVLAKHDLNLQPGDPVELVTYVGMRLSDAKVATVKKDGSIREEERNFLAQQRMHEPFRKASGGLTHAYVVTLDREEKFTMGGVIAAANRMGNGFVVKDCHFGYNRSRAILIKASHGEVSGNHIEGAWMHGILVAPEYWWLESGSSSDLKITGNTITACLGIPICIEALAGNGSVAPAGAHSAITIADNTIQQCAAPAIVVTSTKGLKLGNNRLDLLPAGGTIPRILSHAGIKEIKPVMTLNVE
jgi:hypothetical protein